MIQLNNISKKYADFTAIQDLNLHIKKGEIFGFLGPNGAGKTTTIKMITGILPPSTGEIIIDGVELAKYPKECKRKFG